MTRLLSLIVQIVSWAALLLGMALTVGFLYLYFFEGNPPAVLTVPYRTTEGFYRPGEAITLTAQTCKQTRYPLTVYPELVYLPEGQSYPSIQGKITALPGVQTPGTPAGCGEYTITGFFYVPRVIQPGRYYLKASDVFHVNFLRDRSLEWYTNEFEVLPPE